MRHYADENLVSVARERSVRLRRSYKDVFSQISLPWHGLNRERGARLRNTGDMIHGKKNLGGCMVDREDDETQPCTWSWQR